MGSFERIKFYECRSICKSLKTGITGFGKVLIFFKITSKILPLKNPIFVNSQFRTYCKQHIFLFPKTEDEFN